MNRIEEMFAFVASEDDGEGVAAAQMGNMLMPLVGADAARVDSMRGIAQAICNATGRRITLVRFSQREELEVMGPKQGMN